MKYLRRQKTAGLVVSLALLNSLALAESRPEPSGEEDESIELEQVEISGQQQQPQPLDGSAEAGYRSDTAQLGPFGKVRPQNTPFSITSVSSGLIRNIQATTTTEALKYAPTVYNNTGSSQITPYYTIRGFSASTWSYNMAVDGMRSFDVYQPMEDKERIEVISGATGFLYGITSPAGMINHALKRPTRTPLREFTLGLYDEQVYGHLDLGGPITDSLAYRINLVDSDKGDTGGLDHQSQKRYLYSGALDWQISPGTLLSLDASRSRRHLNYAQALFMTTASIGIPKAPDASRNWGAPYTGATDATNRFGLSLDSQLNDLFTLRFKARYSKVEREYFLNRQVWQDPQLDYKWRVDSQSEFNTIVKQFSLFLDTHLNTGPWLKHKITFGITRDSFDAGNNGYHGTTYSTVYSGNLYTDPGHPAWSPPPQGTSSSQETHYKTLIIADQIDAGEHLSLMAGGTRAWVNDYVRSRTAAGKRSVTHYDDNEFSPAYSIAIKPLPWITAYASYVEALQQGMVAGATTANAGEAFAPYVSKQKEVGLKTTLGGLELNLAWFHIRNANQYVDPTTNLASQDGRAVHKGWEFTFTGKATRDLTITGGYTGLNAKITKAASNTGKTPQGVPERMGKLYAEYNLTPVLPGLVVNGGLSYTGKVPWDAANRLYVNPVTTYDAGLRYSFRLQGVQSTWRFNIANLTNKNYWTTRSGILYLGAPRTLSLSTTLAF